MRIGNRMSPLLFIMMMFLGACAETDSTKDSQGQMISDTFSALEEEEDNIEEINVNSTEIIDENVGSNTSGPVEEYVERDYEEEVLDDAKYEEMDIKQFLIDEYHFKEEDIDPDYDLIGFMKDYRLDEWDCSDEEAKASYKRAMYRFLPSADGYVMHFLNEKETEQISIDDKIVKIAYSWESDLSLPDNVLYDLSRGIRYSDGKEPAEITDDKQAYLAQIVSSFGIDKWELSQKLNLDPTVCDGLSGWTLVFELEDGSKRVYSGTYGPGAEIPSEWKSLRNILLN